MGRTEDVVAGSAIAGTKSTRGRIAHHLRPDALRPADHHGIGVRGGFLRQRGNMQSAHDHFGLPPPILIGHQICLVDRGGERRDSHEVEMRQRRKLRNTVQLQILDLVLR